MAHHAIAANDVYVTVTRAGAPLANNDTYIPGEMLEVFNYYQQLLSAYIYLINLCIHNMVGHSSHRSHRKIV